MSQLIFSKYIGYCALHKKPLDMWKLDLYTIFNSKTSILMFENGLKFRWIFSVFHNMYSIREIMQYTVLSGSTMAIRKYILSGFILGCVLGSMTHYFAKWRISIAYMASRWRLIFFFFLAINKFLEILHLWGIGR